jgi:ABC-type lipopolysaccharide export system ATPase subunit
MKPRLHRLARLGVFVLPERDLLPRGQTVGTLLRMIADTFASDDALGDAIERLRLGVLLDRMPGTLSGGELRRAEVAAAVARAPRVLFADEPFMGIAPNDADIIADAFRHLASQGCALVVSGHEIEQVLDVADEVMWMTAGTTHSLGTPQHARQHWQFRKEYLGTQGVQHTRGNRA